MIDKNVVSAYVKNENVAISEDGGIVTLNDGLVTHQVVTFYGNNGVTLEGSQPQYTQNIVTNTNSRLTPNKFSRGGYNFNGWNSRPDGLGTDYTDEHLMNISEDITLYAKWQAQWGAREIISTIAVVASFPNNNKMSDMTLWAIR